MIKPLSDEAIHELTDHWNPLPSRLDGIAPETIKLRLFQAVAQEALRDTLRQVVENGAEIHLDGYGLVIQFSEGFWQELKKQAGGMPGETPPPSQQPHFHEPDLTEIDKRDTK